MGVCAPSQESDVNAALTGGALECQPTQLDANHSKAFGIL
jgi:hypothetical protein